MRFPRRQNRSGGWPMTLCVVLLGTACTGGAGGSASGQGGSGGEADGPGGQGASTEDETGGTTATGGSGAGGSAATGGGAGGGGTAAGGSGTGGRPGAGGASTAGGAGGTPPGLVPMFIASGRGGRRMMSCDDGRTWQTDCQTDGAASGPCLVVNDENDHAAWASQGIAHDGAGRFLALYGWFGTLPSAQVLRTDDGVHWDNVFGGPGKPQGTYGSQISFGNQVFVINAQRSGTHRTLDGGDTWSSKEFSQADRPHRRSMTFVPFGPGRFISYGDLGRATYSDDNGVTWVETTSTTCSHLGAFAWGNGVLLASDGGGTCRSTDGGLVWTERSAPSTRSNPLWTGSEFFIWESGKASRSPDGATWTSTTANGSFGRNPGVNGGGWPALIARSDGGKFVGIDELGDVFFTSDDGNTWTRKNGPIGTTLTELIFGHGKPSAGCPAR